MVVWKTRDANRVVDRDVEGAEPLVSIAAANHM